MKEQTFTVEGMKCEHCEMNVEKAVMSVAGVQSAKADRNAKSLTVVYDESAVSPADIKNAVEDAGRFEMETPSLPYGHPSPKGGN
jgi:copper chaperone